MTRVIYQWWEVIRIVHMLWVFTILKHNEIDNGRQNEHQQIDYLSSRLQQIIMRYDFLHVKVMKVIHKKIIAPAFLVKVWAY